jgi:hypothetical protein
VSILCLESDAGGRPGVRCNRLPGRYLGKKIERIPQRFDPSSLGAPNDVAPQEQAKQRSLSRRDSWRPTMRQTSHR